MFKFLHSADLHIDSPLRGLEQYDGAPVERLRGATRRAFESLIDLALAENVAFVLFAGDLYDGDWRDYNTGLFFVQQLGRLREAGIRAYLLYGNHDAQNKMTRNLRLPDNVFAFHANQPQTFRIDQLDVAIHGQSFTNPEETTDLSARYPEADRKLFNIGMLHTCADGREGHGRYAPTTVDKLAGKGYAYWALGHVHKREILRQDPWIVFPGNIQGRHIRETGAKGCTLVTVVDGEVHKAEHRSVDVVRWTRRRVSAEGAATGSDLLDRIARSLDEAAAESEDRLTAVRLEIHGACGAHAELSLAQAHWMSEIRGLAAANGNDIWVEKIKLETQSPISLEELMGRDDALGGLVRSIASLGALGQPDAQTSGPADAQASPELWDELFADLRTKLRKCPWPEDSALDLLAPEALKSALPEVKDLLLTRLLSQGGA